MNAILQIPIIEFAELWAELVTAFEGVNHYGGHTAELYAYRFQKYNPAVHSAACTIKSMVVEAEMTAGRALQELLTEFKQHYDCKIKVDGYAFRSWSKRRIPFAHRVHVEVKP